jgi:hypothetical protein
MVANRKINQRSLSLGQVCMMGIDVFGKRYWINSARLARSPFDANCPILLYRGPKNAYALAIVSYVTDGRLVIQTGCRVIKNVTSAVPDSGLIDILTGTAT